MSKIIEQLGTETVYDRGDRRSQTHNRPRGMRRTLAALGATVVLGALAASTQEAQAATLAVIDTGGSPTAHVDPSLSYNAVDGSTDVTDTFGHGTSEINDIERELDNPQLQQTCKTDCKIMVIKVANPEGLAMDDATTRGINRARTHGASVILLAIGSDAEPTPALNAEIAAAIAQGIPVIIAAGNQASTAEANLLAYRNQPAITSVAAVDEFGRLLATSNRGDIDMAATGISTSEASAKVAAVVLAIKRGAPQWSAADIENFLISTCIKIPDLPIRTHCVLRLGFAQGTSVPPVWPTPAPPATKEQPAKELVIEKQGPGRLSVNSKACDPQCVYSYKKNTSFKLTATPPNKRTRVILPDQCQITLAEKTALQKRHRVVCRLSAAAATHHKHFTVKFLRPRKQHRR